MINNYFHIIESFLSVYGIVAVFSLGIIEEITFFIPTSLLFVAAGFFLIDPYLNFPAALFNSFIVVGLPGSIGVLVGGLAVYAVAYWGGKKFIKKFGGYVGVTWDDIENLNNKFKRGRIDEMILFILRAIPILPIGVISIFCGLVRYNRWHFIFATFLGTIVRLSGLSLLGWYLGKEYIKYTLQIAAIERYLIIIFLLVILISLFYHHGKYSRYRAKENS